MAVNYAFTGNVDYSTFTPTSKSNFIDILKNKFASRGWISAAITNGYRLHGKSPQNYDVYLDIWDPGNIWWTTPIALRLKSYFADIYGATHYLQFSGGRAYQLHVSRCQFFISVPGMSSDAWGSAACGGIPHMTDECGRSEDPVTEVWWSMGDTFSNPFFIAASPRTNLRTFVPNTFTWTSPCTGCYNGVVITGIDPRWSGVPQIFPIQSAATENPLLTDNSHPLWVDGTALRYVAQIGWGDAYDKPAKIRGQLYDAVIQSKVSAIDTEETFDGHDWICYTNSWYWGNLWILKGTGAVSGDLWNYCY